MRYKNCSALYSGDDGSSMYDVRIDVPPKALINWTTIEMTCPVAIANCTAATENIILCGDISNLMERPDDSNRRAGINSQIPFLQPLHLQYMDT
jgi:hypothetical protein